MHPGPATEEVLLSSAILCDQIRLMREAHGDELVARAEAALPARLREELASLTPSGHCSLELARELKSTVAGLAGIDPLAFQREISRRGTERTLTTLWRFFLRQLGDEAVSKRVPLLYSRVFSRGALTLTSWKKGGAELELSGWPQMPDYDLVGLLAGGETLFELAGRVEVKVTATRRPPLILVHASWRR